MIVVVGGIKGGSGKTTIATNLTVMRSLLGFRVLLIDADEQRSVSDWTEQRVAAGIETKWTTIQKVGKYLYVDIQKMAPDYDDIIIDVGGRDTTSQRSALSVADKFIIPFQPRSLDIWTVSIVKALISEMSIANKTLKSYAFINRGDSRGVDNEDALKILSEYSEITCLNTISQRKIFANAASEGLGVLEFKNADKKAIEELQELYQNIYEKYMTNI